VDVMGLSRCYGRKPPIYINKWIADWLFAKQPASEATE